MTATKINDQVLASTVALVCSYVANNSLPARELLDLLRLVHESLTSLFPQPTPRPELDGWLRMTPMAIRNSIGPDGVVSFIDGKTYQVLKRHLRVNGLDPDGYRERFGLPASYPMTAPGYSRRRSRLAKDICFGTRRQGAA